ncbi:MAG TPA: LysM peptidoglycan-binding domain-containing protein [Bryobacteraceae bacterium]|nr:LysM peptidoglycan-binding domain-containing protein [Bryobacteraceae bacterium]
MADEQQLKSKYSSVISAAPQLGISLQNVHLENGKLLIRGKAPNENVKNEIWNRIKAIDPGYSDLVADISIDPSLPQPAAASSAGDSSRNRSAGQTYTVQSGDTLSKISKQFYGNANDYNRIFEANRDKLSDPDKIQVGQELVIP